MLDIVAGNHGVEVRFNAKFMERNLRCAPAFAGKEGEQNSAAFHEFQNLFDARIQRCKLAVPLLVKPVILLHRLVEILRADHLFDRGLFRWTKERNDLFRCQALMDVLLGDMIERLINEKICLCQRAVHVKDHALKAMRFCGVIQ